MGWGFLVIFEKKAVSWDLNLDESSWDCGVRARLLGQLAEIWDWTKRFGVRIWAKPVQLPAAGCTRIGWVSELRADAERTVSIVKIVCHSLSSCRKPKSQEDNKSFVPEPRESSVFRESYARERFIHPYIQRICMFYVFVLFISGYVTKWRQIVSAWIWTWFADFISCENRLYHPPIKEL